MSISPLVTNEAIKAAQDAAFFGGRFRGWAPQDEARVLRAEADAKALAQASALRLVQAAKSPTRGAGRDAALFLAGWRAGNPGLPPAPRLVEQSPEWARDAGEPGTFAVFEHREWSDEYRVRFETVTAGGTAAPDQSGARETERLTHRGARKISDSCFFLAKKRGGFSTFLTLTLTPEAREKLETVTAEPVGELSGGFLILGPDHVREYTRDERVTSMREYRHDQQGNETGGPFVAVDTETGRPFSPVRWRHAWSVQREASRFFEAVGKMYVRGWQYQNEKGQTVKVPGSPKRWLKPGRLHPETKRPFTPLADGPYTAMSYHAEPLDYMWVAEAPDRIDKETGEYLGGTNPHIHVLMRWRVDYRHFEAWAARVEKLWGQGTAHLEKIKEPEAAGAYMAKAAGYLTKGEGQDASQGVIRGNRYGISARARAPAWACLERSQVGILGCLMAEAGEHWKTAYGPEIVKRDRLKEKLSAEVQKGERQKIGKILEGVRGKIEALPRISKHAAILKGREQYEAFRAWAESNEAANGPEWLPAKDEGEGFRREKGQGIWFAEFRRRQWFRRNGRRLRMTEEDFKHLCVLADAGAVFLDEDERWSA